MSYLESGKKEKRIVLVVIITILVSFFPYRIKAESISPNSTKVNQTAGGITNETLEITNDKEYDIYITPKVYKYYPQSEYILEPKPFEEFVKIDTDSILVGGNSTKTIKFQVLGVEALDPGTYYNLIVFTKKLDNSANEDSSVGTTALLSHLVTLNLIADPYLDKITEDFDFNLTVIDKGIPFFKPAKLGVTFFNNSKYTLIPKGEIQVVKHKEDKEPEYIKVNLDRNRAYPKDSLEMEFQVNSWYLSDIFFGKTAYLKLQNGIDDGIYTKEVQIPGFKNESIYVLIALVVIMALVRSVKGDIKQDSKPS